jgi:uncharacterized membrane protein
MKARKESREMDKAFVLRRLETLSDTIFGIAMTMLVYNIPAAGRLGAAPRWSELLATSGRAISALCLSFFVAALFWFSHHRRLVLGDHETRAALLINIVFLFTIVCLPATTALYGSKGNVGDVVAIYNGHLALISLFNAALWMTTFETRRKHKQAFRMTFLISPLCAAGILSFSALISLIWPSAAQVLMFTAFLAPLAEVAVERRAAIPSSIS